METLDLAFLRLDVTRSFLVGLIEFSAKATAIVLLALVATSLLRSRPAALRHAVWISAIVGLLGLPLSAALVPDWRVLPNLPSSAVSYGIDASARPSSPGSSLSMPAADQENRVRSVTDQPAGSDGPVGTARIHPVVSAMRNAAGWAVSLHWSVWLVILWALGALGVLMQHAIGAWGLTRLIRTSRPLQRAEWTDLKDEIADRLRVSRSVRLLADAHTTMPMTWGGLHPVILLPSGCETWTADKRRAVVTHEMAHVARWDTTTQALAQLACALYWFNPLVWIAARHLRVERERACDDLVLATGGTPSVYAQQLLEIASSVGRNRSTMLGAVAFARPSQLEGRVLAILDPARRRSSVGSGPVRGMAVVAILLTMPLAALAPAVPADADGSGGRPAAPLQVAPDRPLESVLTASSGSDSSNGREEAPSTTGERLQAAPSVVLGEGSAPVYQVAQPDTIRDKARLDALVAALTAALANFDEQVRYQAAYALAELGDRRGVEPLRGVASSDPSGEVRRAALRALVELEPPAALPLIRSGLAEETDPEMRRDLLFMAAELEDPSAAELAVSLVSDPAPEVRAAALMVLSASGDESALPAVVAALDDPDEVVRRQALFALAGMAGPGSAAESAVPHVLRALVHDDPEIRMMALHILAELGSEQHADAVARALDDPEPEVRAAALQALNEVGGKPDDVQLIRLLETDSSSRVRQMAAWMLGESGSLEAIRALMGALDAVDVEVRRAAAQALTMIDDSEGERD